MKVFEYKHTADNWSTGVALIAAKDKEQADSFLEKAFITRNLTFSGESIISAEDLEYIQDIIKNEWSFITERDDIQTTTEGVLIFNYFEG